VTDIQLETGSNNTAGHLSLRETWPFFLYLGAILVAFYRAQLFFYLDEYAGIARLAAAPSFLKFIFQPHNEHVIPLFHSFWALEVYVFREHYALYVLTNIVLLASIGLIWQRLLLRVGVQPAVAVIVPLLAVTCLSQADNVMAAWQSSLLLSAAALLGVLHAYVRLRFFYIVLFSCCAALTFTSSYALPAVIALYLLLDYFFSMERRLIFWAAGLILLFFLLVAFPALFRSVSSSHLLEAIWEGQNTGAKIAHLAWLFWYTLGIAFYGPLNHLLEGRVPDGPSDIMTAISLLFFLVVLGLSRKDRSRELILKLLVLQFALFALISPFRHTPTFVGYSGRYYTAGLIPWLSAAAIGFSELLQRFRIPSGVTRLLLTLLVLLAARNVWCSLGKPEWLLVERGRAARVNYYQTKEWLRQHEMQNQPIGNIVFSQSVAPWLDLKMMVGVIGLLDPSFVTVPVSLKKVTYIENIVNTRGWGPIVEGQPAIQTFRVPHLAVAVNMELLVSRYAGFQGVSRISLDDDAGHDLWSIAIPSELWPANTWLAVPIGGTVQFEPERTYSIRVASTANSPAAPTVWMNLHPDSYPSGETRTPDGATGVLCFRLGLMEP
jgi:hypothetical protein